MRRFFTTRKAITMKRSFSLRIAIPAVMLALAACGEAPAANGQPAAVAQKNGTAPAEESAATKIGAGVPAEVGNTIRATLEKNYADQNLKIESVATTPIKGVYEVVIPSAAGKTVAYTDETGAYMLVGDLIETKAGRSLTDERKEVLNAVDFNSLPFDKAITEVRGNGKLKVAVFSDPDCPFCKKLEHEFPKINNITIYNFMMPIPSLHPDAERKAVQIWCQKDRTSAWLAWMRQGKQPAQVADCPNPVAETTALGNRFGFNGTPTLVFPNGKVQSGYAPMPHLQEAIEANQK